MHPLVWPTRPSRTHAPRGREGREGLVSQTMHPTLIQPHRPLVLLPTLLTLISTSSPLHHLHTFSTSSLSFTYTPSSPPHPLSFTYTPSFPSPTHPPFLHLHTLLSFTYTPSSPPHPLPSTYAPSSSFHLLTLCSGNSSTAHWGHHGVLCGLYLSSWVLFEGIETKKSQEELCWGEVTLFLLVL